MNRSRAEEARARCEASLAFCSEFVRSWRAITRDAETEEEVSWMVRTLGRADELGAAARRIGLRPARRRSVRPSVRRRRAS